MPGDNRDGDMDVLANFIVGPELLWLLLALFTRLTIYHSGPPKARLDAFWLRMNYIVPFCFIPLTFALHFCPLVSPHWLLLRIWAAGIVGGNYVLTKSLEAHSEKGPGVGTAYIMGMTFIFVVLLAGSLYVIFKQF